MGGAAKRRLSMSKSALLLSPCLRWAGENAKAYEEDFTDTTKRDIGIAFHDVMDRYYRSLPFQLPDSARPEVRPMVQAAIGWSQDYLEQRLDVLWSEVYVGYNFTTGESHEDLGVRNRQYPDMPGFVPGTADIMGYVLDDHAEPGSHLYVGDWKTGKGTGAEFQLMSMANGFVASRPHVRRITLAILYVTEENGKPVIHPVEWEVTREDLEAHRFAMMLQLQDVGVRNEPVQGIHCTQLYCPHLAYCPAITKDTDTMAQEVPSRGYSLTEAPASAEHAGDIMQRLTAAKRQIEFLQARVRKYADQGGRVIAGQYEYSKGRDGYRWRPRKDEK